MFVEESTAVIVDIPELLIFPFVIVSSICIPLTLSSLIVPIPWVAAVATPTVIFPDVNSRLSETGINDLEAYNFIWLFGVNCST